MRATTRGRARPAPPGSAASRGTQASRGSTHPAGVAGGSAGPGSLRKGSERGSPQLAAPAMATALPLARRLFVSASPLLPDKWLWQGIRRAFGAPRGRRARVLQPWRVVVGTSLTSPQGKELDALKNVLGRPAPARELIYKPEPVLPAPAIPGAAPKARTRPCLAGSGLFMASGREPGRRGDCTAPSGLGPVRPTPSAVSVPGVCLPEPSTRLCAEPAGCPEAGRRPAAPCTHPGWEGPEPPTNSLGDQRCPSPRPPGSSISLPAPENPLLQGPSPSE